MEKDRPSDINIESGISDKDGVLTLYGSGTEASFDAEDVHVKGKTTKEIPVRSLAGICEEYIDTQEIHFLKVDVEGWEKQCLEGMDFKRWRPWIILIESYDPSTGAPAYPQWENILTEASYDFVVDDSTNRYYIAREHKDIASRILSLEKLNKLYDVTRYSDKYLYARLMKYQGIERTMTRIKGSFIMTPIRKMYFKCKASKRNMGG